MKKINVLIGFCLAQTAFLAGLAHAKSYETHIIVGDDCPDKSGKNGMPMALAVAYITPSSNVKYIKLKNDNELTSIDQYMGYPYSIAGMKSKVVLNYDSQQPSSATMQVVIGYVGYYFPPNVGLKGNTPIMISTKNGRYNAGFVIGTYKIIADDENKIYKVEDINNNKVTYLDQESVRHSIQLYPNGNDEIIIDCMKTDI